MARQEMTASELRAVAPINAIQRPSSVVARNGFLEWKPGAGKWEPAPPDLLAKFRALRDASDEKISQFAGRFGVLQLLENGLPVSSAPRPLPLEPTPGRIYPEPLAREPVAIWHQYVTQVQAILNVAARLRDESEPQRADIQLMRLGPIRVHPATSTHGRAAIREELAQIVRAYIAAGDVRPGLVWTVAASPRLEFRGGLFGAIALGLLQAISGEMRIQFCEDCGRDYQPLRAPRPGEHHFCPDCRAKGARQRRWNKKNREGANA